jgi:uncharacterized protein
MRYNIAQLLKEPTGSTRSDTVDEGSLLLDEVTVDRLEGQLLLTRTDAGIWVHGSLGAETPATCSRCLEEFSQPLALELDEQYYPMVDPASGAPLADALMEDDSFRVSPAQVLDVGEAVRQHVIARMPMKPLCHPDCAGICPQCGANRNVAPCLCTEHPQDPRWARLQQILASAEPRS